MTGEHAEPGPSESRVGSVGDEAAKLLDALQGWAGGAASPGVADQLHALNEHIATGGTECMYCPVCQLIGKARDASPEVRSHLAVGVSSLLQAAAVLIETRAPKPPSAPSTPGPPPAGSHSDPSRVTKIDLDEEPPPPGHEA